MFKKIVNFINNLFKSEVTSNVTVNQKLVKDPLDRITYNLYVGKILDLPHCKCEILTVEENNFIIKMVNAKGPHFHKFMKNNKIYTAFKNSFLDVWEINNRTSQLLFYWKKDYGWTTLFNFYH